MSSGLSPRDQSDGFVLFSSALHCQSRITGLVQSGCAFTYIRRDLAAGNDGSACSHALQVLRQSIFAGRVAADDSLKGLVALNVVGDSLEEGLVADGCGIVWLAGLGVGGFGRAVSQVKARTEVHCHFC